MVQVLRIMLSLVLSLMLMVVQALLVEGRSENGELRIIVDRLKINIKKPYFPISQVFCSPPFLQCEDVLLILGKNCD